MKKEKIDYELPVDIKLINTKSKEGKLLMAALVILSTGTESNKTLDETLRKVERLSKIMYEK